MICNNRKPSAKYEIISLQENTVQILSAGMILDLTAGYNSHPCKRGKNCCMILGTVVSPGVCCCSSVERNRIAMYLRVQSQQCPGIMSLLCVGPVLLQMCCKVGGGRRRAAPVQPDPSPHPQATWICACNLADTGSEQPHRLTLG